MRKGFSLIELSVVLVIIGLLIGVLIAARSIRHTAQIQAVISDLGKYKTAALQYKEKYYYLPGDDPNAANVWTRLAGDHGDGDGRIYGCSTEPCTNWTGTGGIAPNGEAKLVFEELAAGGYTTGTFSSANSQNPADHFPVAPVDGSSNITNGYYTKPLYYYYYQTLGGINKNTISLAAFLSNGEPIGSITADKALVIDTKIDDGVAATGYIRGFDTPTYASLKCLNAGGNYDLTLAVSNCILTFAME